MSITADQEKRGRRRPPDAAVHRRRVARRRRRRDARGRGPVDRRDARRGRRRHGRGRHRRARRRVRRAGRVGRAPAARARRDPAPRLRGDHRAGRRAGAADDARDGQAAGRVARPRSPTRRSSSAGSPRRRCGSRAATRPRPNGAGRLLTMKQPVGPCLLDHALELPDGDGHAQDRPGDRRRLHDGRQARAADAAVDARAGRDPRGGRACRRACSTSSPRARARRGLEADHRATRGCASSRSPARPRSAASWSSSPPQSLLRISMELGGNAPFLVFDDADVDAAVEGAVIAKMRNIGEACTAANRFHVADKVADEFTEKLADEARRDEGRARHRGRRQGRPADRRRRSATRSPSSSTTPIGKGAQRARRRPDARRRRLLLRADRARRRPGDARLLKEEIFGPVAPVVGFDDEDAAIAAANDTEYGLVAYVYTQRHQARVPRRRGARRPAWSASTRASSPTRRRRSAASRQSGFGREGGAEGIEEYLEIKYVAMAM